MSGILYSRCNRRSFMIEDQASRTAQGTARRRAIHQLWDDPKVFDDPVALKIIGEGAAAELAAIEPRDLTSSVSLRAFLVARSRYAEDQLAAAVARGVSQYVILGAGLDTFGYRNPFSGLGVFEVDHPATQVWKRQLLHAAHIDLPLCLTFAPVDFEKETLPEALAKAGFRHEQPAFFSWLGVTPYLERKTVLSTLRWIITVCSRNAVVFDYTVPRELLNSSSQKAFDTLSARVAAIGEPFVGFFDPGELARELHAMAFIRIEDLGPDEINARYFHNRADNLHVDGAGRIIYARGK